MSQPSCSPAAEPIVAARLKFLFKKPVTVHADSTPLADGFLTVHTALEKAQELARHEPGVVVLRDEFEYSVNRAWTDRPLPEAAKVRRFDGRAVAFLSKDVSEISPAFKAGAHKPTAFEGWTATLHRAERADTFVEVADPALKRAIRNHLGSDTGTLGLHSEKLGGPAKAVNVSAFAGNLYAMQLSPGTKVFKIGPVPS